MMRREEAVQLLKSRIRAKNLLKHMFAAEACMRRLAEYFDVEPDEWALAGLLHDIDYEDTKDDFSSHGILSAELLLAEGVSREICDIVKAHAGKKSRDTLAEKMLYAADPMTGLIVASALMHPEKKLSSLDTAFVMKRFKEKRFAAGADREQIASCSEAGLTLEEFTRICLEAMREIDKELGL